MEDRFSVGAKSALLTDTQGRHGDQTEMTADSRAYIRMNIGFRSSVRKVPFCLSDFIQADGGEKRERENDH